jgi:hypothetical protein
MLHSSLSDGIDWGWYSLGYLRDVFSGDPVSRVVLQLAGMIAPAKIHE